MRRSRLTVIVLVLTSWGVTMPVRAGDASGSRVMVRLYPDWEADPRAYTTLDVPVERFEVRAEALRRAYVYSRLEDGEATSQELRDAETTYRGELREAIVVVVPDDQEEQAVVDMLDGFVFAQFLRQGSLDLRPRDVARMPPKPCLFLDALGQPLPNADVEILMSPGNQPPSAPVPRVWIADAQLDAQGFLLPPQSTAGLSRFTFHVVHPDCGLVPAMPQYTSANDPHYIFKIAAMVRDQWCVFTDALGYPMAGAQVEIITSGSWENGRMTFLEPILLDRAGRMRPPPVFTMPRRCSFLVSDPNYGIALVEPYYMTEVSVRKPLSCCVVPLIARGTPADTGALWGIVVDSDNEPVPGAVVGCMRVSLASGETLGPYWPWPAKWNKEAKVLTNGLGQFGMYLPLADSDGTPGRPVPAGAMYEVTVTPPAELGCQSSRRRLAAGREHVVMLEGTLYGPKKYTGVLLFEDEYGPVKDPEKVSRVNLTIQVRRPNMPRVTHSYRQGEWLEKSALPFGLYEATADWDGKHYTFRAVVTTESPEVVVLRPGKVERFEIRYRGRVVDGTSGSPITDAIIMPAPAAAHEFDFADPQFDPRSEAFKRLEQRMKGRMTRTDRAGRFELVLPVAEKPGSHRLLALKQDYFAYQQPRSVIVPGRRGGDRPRRTEFPIDGSGRVSLTDMKLFPAGTVTIEPNTPDECRGKRVTFDLLPADDNAARWLADFQAPPGDGLTGSVIRRNDLAPRVRQGVRVPAYAPLVLRLQVADERYAPTLVEDVLVGHGKTFDLGRIDFARLVPMAVKLVNAADEPLAGVAVKCLLGESGCPGPEAVTDADGIAHLRVAAHSAGRLILEYEDPQTKTKVRADTPYRVAGAEDAAREFVLQLCEASPGAEHEGAVPAPDETRDE